MPLNCYRSIGLTIGCIVVIHFSKRIDYPINLKMYASFTIMAESVDRYALVIQTPVLGFCCCFIVYLWHPACFSPL